MTRMAATRDGYGQALLELAENDKVVVLEADLGKSTKSLHFRKAHPERTISCGIGEQNMLLVAAGMASSGYIPFASTFAIFTERAFEQMRNGVARPNLAVHVCGSHGGTHTGTDGSSAQSIEDLAIYRTLPNVTVLHPCDDVSTRLLTKQLADSGSPSYMRTARNKTPVLYDDVDPSTIQIGKGIELRDGADVAIIACGVLVSEALKAADALSEQVSKQLLSTCTQSSHSTHNWLIVLQNGAEPSSLQKIIPLLVGLVEQYQSTFQHHRVHLWNVSV